MSWSLTFIGTAEKINAALDAKSAKLDNQSKIEFDSALPHMKALVSENRESGYEPLLKLTANGHGYAVDGEQKSRTLQINIERISGEVV